MSTPSFLDHLRLNGLHSSPGDTQCFESAEEYNAFFNGTIEMNGITYTGNFTNSTDVQNLLSQAPSFEEKYEQVGQKCLNGSNGDFLQYMGTAATVRDMVAIADVLDGPDAPINYFGISYGALLGSWFINSELLMVCHAIPHRLTATSYSVP